MDSLDFESDNVEVETLAAGRHEDRGTAPDLCCMELSSTNNRIKFSS